MMKKKQNVVVKPYEPKAGKRFNQEELQQEYNYIQAKRITKRLLEKGLISAVEFRRIMAENRKSFPTLLAPLLPVY